MSSVQLAAFSAMECRSGAIGREGCSEGGGGSGRKNPMQAIYDIPAGVNKNHACGAVARGIEDIAKGSSSKNTILRISASLRKICCAASPLLLLAAALCPVAQANGMRPVCPLQEGHVASRTITRASLPGIDEDAGCASSADVSEVGNNHFETSRQLIVIGFMGGRVRANNLIHKEALVVKGLQEGYPFQVFAAAFANHDGHMALSKVLQLLDENRDGNLSANERNAARIVIFGHSWGASETVTLAGKLNKLSIPVLLTIQVDSVQKRNQHDGQIPPNVREAINFYQSEGLLHGRSFIEAMDPKQTTILGNYESTYRRNPVSCAGYPWFARTFMRSHIEIENDPFVWSKIEAL